MRTKTHLIASFFVAALFVLGASAERAAAQTVVAPRVINAASAVGVRGYYPVVVYPRRTIVPYYYTNPNVYFRAQRVYVPSAFNGGVAYFYRF